MLPLFILCLPLSLSTQLWQKLGEDLARMHLSRALDEVHSGRYGFMVNNFLSLTPMDNRWTASWPRFLARRMATLIRSLFEPKSFARAPLQRNEENQMIITLGQDLLDRMEEHFQGVEIQPSLLHGDLWIGNIGTNKHVVCREGTCPRQRKTDCSKTDCKNEGFSVDWGWGWRGTDGECRSYEGQCRTLRSSMFLWTPRNGSRDNGPFRWHYGPVLQRLPQVNPESRRL